MLLSRQTILRTQRTVAIVIMMTVAYSAEGAWIFVAGEGSPLAPANTLVISGDIEAGDYERSILEIKSAGRLPTAIMVDSAGGNVQDAIKIGRFARESLISVVIPTKWQCNSSCFLILVGGASRAAFDPIGIHRPYYDRDMFSELSASEAQRRYRDMDQKVREYLLEMDVPESFIDRMMSIKSTDVEFVTPDEFRELIGTESPAFEEWIIAKCGDMVDDEYWDYIKISTISTLKWMQEAIVSDEYSEEQKANIRRKMPDVEEKAEYAISTYSKGYRDYLVKKNNQINGCRKSSVEEHKTEVFSRL